MLCLLFSRWKIYSWKILAGLGISSRKEKPSAIIYYWFSNYCHGTCHYQEWCINPPGFGKHVADNKTTYNYSIHFSNQWNIGTIKFVTPKKHNFSTLFLLLSKTVKWSLVPLPRQVISNNVSHTPSKYYFPLMKSNLLSWVVIILFNLSLSPRYNKKNHLKIVLLANMKALILEIISVPNYHNTHTHGTKCPCSHSHFMAWQIHKV